MKHFSILLLFGLLSCGGDSGNSDEFEREEEQLPEPELIQKVYRADLRPINPSVENDVEGQVVVRLEDESFEVNVGVRNISGEEHPQHIRTGKECPGPQHDLNRDGIIDLSEATAVSGDVYIPLDDDLDQVVTDNGKFPNGGFLRAYGYREDTTRAQLVRELGAESTIAFQDRVLMVLGTDLNDELPATVASPDGRIPQETLPVACGELTPVVGPE